MQTIEVTGATGIGPYDVYICDITLTNCFLISGATSIPPTVYFDTSTSLPNPSPPPILINFGYTSSVVIKIVDLSTGCEKFIPYQCPSATPTPTPTITPSSSPSDCLCISILNPTTSGLTFAFTDCTSNIIDDTAPALSTLFVCGKSPTGQSGLIITVNGPCVSGACPPIYLTPTQTASQTPTPTPSQTTPIVNGKIFQMGDLFIYMNGDIYIFQNQ